MKTTLIKFSDKDIELIEQLKTVENIKKLFPYSLKVKNCDIIRLGITALYEKHLNNN